LPGTDYRNEKGRVGDWIVAAALLIGTALILVWGPGGVTRWAVEAFDLEMLTGTAGGEQEQTISQSASGTVVRTEVGEALAQAITEPRVAATLARFASMPSRVPGYPGAEEAAREIRAAFERIGLVQVAVDTFQVTVPVDKGGALTVAKTGERIALHALWPNQVRGSTTPPEGISGRLIDGGRGEFADFNGWAVDGSIVLMGFGCGLSYLNARMLGARAILFYDDGQVSREQALDKFIKVPADVPRFWIAREDAERLLQEVGTGEIQVTAQSRMDWESVPAHNILGYLPGLDRDLPGDPERNWQDDTLVLSAYYDAISVVPALAPGAENACSITALLQLAEYLAANRPHYPVLFLATGAHFEGLSGINDFLYRHARRSDYFRERMEEPIDFRLFIGLDLSSQNDQVAAFAQGTFYTGWKTNTYLKNLLTPHARRFAGYVEEIFPGDRGTDRYLDAVAPSKQTWKDFMPVGLGLDSEAPIFVGLSGLSLVTPHDLRHRVDTPLDRLEQVDIQGLTRQIRTIGGILTRATRDPELFGESALELKDQGHSLAGNIYWFDREVNFAVPQAPIAGAVVTYQQTGANSIAGVRTLMVTQTDSAGRFRYDILRNTRANKVLAYKLDEFGEIAWAPDLGGEGNAIFPITQNYVWWEDEMVEVLFPCRSLTLLQTVDARQLVALDKPTILGENDAPPQWYGEDYIANQSQIQGKVALATVVYARPGTRIKILMSTGLVGVKYLLTDAPYHFLEQPIAAAQATPELLEEAKGRGLLVDRGFIPYPLFRSTADMWIIDDVRMKILERYGVRNDRMVRLHEQTRTALMESRKALDGLQYDRSIAALRKAAGFESRAYPDVKATASDTVNGIVFYFVLLIPFSFFMERLLFGFADIRRQLAAFVGLFILVFSILHLVHPAFKLSSSPYIILLAFVILAMGIAVIGLILTKFKEEMRKMKRQAEGIFEADVGRLGATMAAVLLGISNLRKRKIRTGLTAVTLILVSFTTLSFTSISSTIQFYRLPRGDEVAYEGALVRERNWKGLQQVALEYVRSNFGEKAAVVPRAWYLLPEASGRAHIRFSVTRSRASSAAYGIVGLSSEEPRIMGIDRLLLEGGRWFRPGERQVCILPDDLAALVAIGPKDMGQVQIRLLGKEYTVIGLIDAEAFNRMQDLDQEKLTPVDMVTESSAMTAAQQDPEVAPTAPIRSFIHLETSNIMLLPYAEVMEMGGSLRSIAIAEFDGNLPGTIESFVTRVALPTFVGHEGKVTVYSSLGTASFSGLGNLIIPLLIAALIILNTMMGSVYERVREIGIYSSLGLTPLHVSALFLAEASVFATIGAVMGYLLGQTLAMGLASFDMLQGITLNFSSLSAISSTLIVMVTVFLSTAYPAKKAADMTVPDVNRKWTFTEPEGNDWAFDFPFTVAGGEVLALYAYLTQVFASYGEGSIGEFLTEDVAFTVVAEEEGEPGFRIAMQAWLAPYDLGIAQQVSMEAIPTGEHRIYRIEMHIHRLSGDVASWKRINRGFLNVLRKRFLVWRTIPPEIRRQYAATGEEMLAARRAVG